MTLFSNSSFAYFPENKTTHFVTKLPKHVSLQGRWAVALLDIHIPLNFQNVPPNEESRRVSYNRTDDREYIHFFNIYPGIYKDLDELMKELNSNSADSHLEFIVRTGLYVAVRRSCGPGCKYVKHRFDLSRALKKILGFEPGRRLYEEDMTHEIWSDFPVDMNANLPKNLFANADICQPYITGDIYSKLLRNVALDVDTYTYGRTFSKSFLRPVYVPLSTTSFETIEIMINDETGEKVPIDHGTLTLTLHFKRLS